MAKKKRLTKTKKSTEQIYNETSIQVKDVFHTTSFSNRNYLFAEDDDDIALRIKKIIER